PAGAGILPHAPMSPRSKPAPTPIAVVGIGALLPGAPDAAELWRVVVGGRDCVTEVPPDYWRVDEYFDPDPRTFGKTYARRGAFLPKVDFDPAEFGIPPRVIPSIDTVQLLTLLVARRLLEGCSPVVAGKVDRRDISVILG